jgi:glycosyltransferase involved in cell wall biosynthesis
MPATLPTAQPSRHILFVTGEYPPMPGGVGAYTAEVAAALVGRGWQVSVLTSHGAQTPAAASSEMAGEIAVYPIMRHWRWNVLREGAQWAKKLGANWLHVQYQTAAFAMHPAINLAPLWWQRQGWRVAWTYHDILVPYLFPKAGDGLRRWVTDLPARVCDLTITTNAGDRSHLAPLARNLVTIPIGSNIQAHILTPSEWQAQHQLRRAQRGYGEDDIVVGYFGFLNHSKGGLDLVESVARLLPDLPTLRLLMIGEQVGASDPSNYAYLQEVKEAIRTRGLEDRVLWTGYQPDAEVSADLAACDLLLLPYLDGASLRRGSLMAGLAHGCAIVTTTPSAPIAELAAGRDLLYVPPGDVDAMVAVVRDLVRDPQRLATLRQNARAASTAFSWQGIAEAHERAYLGVA